MTEILQSEMVNVWGDRGRGGNQVTQNIQSSRIWTDIHNRRTQVGTYISIWADTYTTEGYKWAHPQVYGRAHTQPKDTSGHIHKYMDRHTHNSRMQVGTHTSIWVGICVSTCMTKGHRWAHIQVHGWVHTWQKNTGRHMHTRQWWGAYWTKASNGNSIIWRPKGNINSGWYWKYSFHCPTFDCCSNAQRMLLVIQLQICGKGIPVQVWTGP